MAQAAVVLGGLGSVGTALGVTGTLATVANVATAIGTVASTGIFGGVGSPDVDVNAISSPLETVNLESPEVEAAEAAVEASSENLEAEAQAVRDEQRRRILFNQQAFNSGGTALLGNQQGTF